MFNKISKMKISEKWRSLEVFGGLWRSLEVFEVFGGLWRSLKVFGGGTRF